MDNNLNYGVVGNCRTAALVSARGTIEWMCLPDFDSPSVFASLLDRRKGGCFGFDVAEEYRISQAYIPHTNILATTFSAAEGEFVILDFMPCYRSRRDEHYMPPELYRYVRWVRGRPRLRVHYAPAPDYARGRTEQTVTPEFIESHSLSDPKNRLYLYASLPLGKIARREEIVLERDEFFLLSHNEKVIPVDIEREKLEYCRTLVYWLNWTNRTKRFTYYNDVIERSLLTLKLMSYYNGAVLAALTTSLPESAGDVRNWDRDALPHRTPRSGRPVHALHPVDVRQHARALPNHVRHPRRADIDRDYTGSSVGLQELQTRAHRQRCLPPAAERLVRIPDGSDLPILPPDAGFARRNRGHVGDGQEHSLDRDGRVAQTG